ncbi:MAG TPA: hypothetical protein DEB42_02310 [Jeotgalicoccus sp.]|nr:hypothetical protein [Jeotgalicoccus sp.]
MIKKLSAKFYFYAVDEEGKEVTKSRSIHSLSSEATDAGVNALAAIYENLTGEQYSLVEKVVTHIVD